MLLITHELLVKYLFNRAEHYAKGRVCPDRPSPRRWFHALLDSRRAVIYVLRACGGDPPKTMKWKWVMAQLQRLCALGLAAIVMGQMKDQVTSAFGQPLKNG
jgi:hypothetical protein